MPKLKLHAQQYQKKCGVSETSQRWWNKYLKDLENATSSYNAQELPMWPLQEIKEGKNTQANTHEMSQGNYCGHLMDLDNREDGPFPEVSVIIMIMN